MSATPIHPEDMEFLHVALTQFMKEYERKFIAGAEEHYKLGPFRGAPGRIRSIKEEIQDAWSYVVRLEQRDREIAQRLHAFITRVPLSRENKAELELLLEELVK